MIITIVLFFAVLYGLGMWFLGELVKGQDEHFKQLDKIREDGFR